MANKKVKIDFDDSALYDDEPSVEQIRQVVQTKQIVREEPKAFKSNNSNAINCLRNEKVIVRFVPKKTDNIADKRHVAYGGMMNNATRVFVPPMLSSGSYKNCLTDNEKAYLEDVKTMHDGVDIDISEMGNCTSSDVIEEIFGDTDE
jgi:hypothetical protein